MKRTLSRFCVLAAIVGATACEPATAPARVLAYDFVYEGFGERIIFRWPTGSDIGVYVLPSDDPERSAELSQAFQHTAQVWNDAVLFGEYRLVDAPLEEADVILAWANQTLPIVTEGCTPFPSGAAWITFCLEEGVSPADVASSPHGLEAMHSYPLVNGQHRGGGVHMIVQVLDNPMTDGIVAELVAHEFGHVLGIGTHPCRMGEVGCTRADGAHESLMFSGLPDRATPTAADRATIEVLYHTEPHLLP